MLERSQARAVYGQPVIPANIEREYVSLADIKQFLWRHAPFIAAWAAAGAAIGLFYILTSDPIYTARTQILIEPNIPQILNQQSEINLSLDTSQVETQLAVLRSDKIANMVIDQLDLENNPNFTSPLGAPLGVRIMRLLTLLGLASPDDGTGPDEDGDALTAGEDGEELTEFVRRQRVLRNFQEGLTVTRAGVSYAIDIWFRSRDPELAARIANATAAAFVREQLETRSESASEGLRWLEARIEEVRAQMNHATKVVQEFRARHDFSIPSGDEQSGPTLEELEVTADTYRRMYESLLEAFTSSVNQQPYLIADARVIGEATRPLTSSHPRKTLTLAFTTTAGLLLGLGLAIARHLADRSLRSSRQVQDELGLDVIAELPVVRFRNRGHGGILEVQRQSQSLFSRALRDAARVHLAGDAARHLRLLGVISAVPTAGKGAVAGNLAALAARAGRRTLLIDGDPEHPDLTEFFNGEGGRQRPPNLDFLACTAEPVARLLAGQPEALEAYADHDLVIVNLPDMTAETAYADAAAAMDAVVVVAEWGRTPIDLVQELVSDLRALKVMTPGVVLTKVRSLSTQKYRRRLRWWKR